MSLQNLSDEQKRDLTERIAKWIKPLDHNWSETYDGDYCKRCMNPSWHDDTAEFCDPIYYLTSRDDWALVEEEVYKRSQAQFEKKEYPLLEDLYETRLLEKLGIWDNVINGRIPHGSFNAIRRASPLVCAQALIEVLNEEVLNENDKPN